MPARTGQRDLWRDTERVNRDLDRPARELAVREAFQGARTSAGRGAFSNDDSRFGAAIGEPAHSIIGVLSRRLTPQLSCKGFK
jgi:hypothetical protein